MKYSYTKVSWNSLISSDYLALEWWCMKIFYILLFLGLATYPLFGFDSIPYPRGVLLLLGSHWLLNPVVRVFILCLMSGLSIMYILELKMMFTTIFLSFLSVITLSIGEGNGIMGRDGLLSLVLFAQFIAYAVHYIYPKTNLNKNRVQFSLQMVAAVYMLAALSKISASGIHWVTDSQNLALQVFKSYEADYMTSGALVNETKGSLIASWILENPGVTMILLAGTLAVEFFSFIMLINKRFAFIYGILLLAMHIGIEVAMSIFFPSISLPMVAFTLNPLYLVFLIINTAEGLIRKAISDSGKP